MNYEFEPNHPGLLKAFPGVTVGADPEVVIFDPAGLPISAEGIVPGTKAAPYPVSGGALQLDGVAAEININPASSYPEFRENLLLVLGELQKIIPKGHTLGYVPAVTFNEQTWDGISETAKELGCNPDMNAWTGETNPPPPVTKETRMRTFAGHLHFGWGSDLLKDPDHTKNCFDLVKQLDFFVGWPITSASDITRRELYGKAGACRIKDYGVEYRVPSAMWLHPQLNMWKRIWNASQMAIYQMASGYLPELLPPPLVSRVRENIDSNPYDGLLQEVIPGVWNTDMFSTADMRNHIELNLGLGLMDFEPDLTALALEE